MHMVSTRTQLSYCVTHKPSQPTDSISEMKQGTALTVWHIRGPECLSCKGATTPLSVHTLSGNTREVLHVAIQYTCSGHEGSRKQQSCIATRVRG